MPYCMAQGCTHSTKKADLPSDVGFHRLPRDPTQLNSWLSAVGRLNFIPTQYSTLCSAHFTDEDYDLSSLLKVELLGQKRKRHLKDGVIPSVNLSPPKKIKRRGRGRPRKTIPLLNQSTLAVASSSTDPNTTITDSQMKISSSNVKDRSINSNLQQLLRSASPTPTRKSSKNKSSPVENEVSTNWSETDAEREPVSCCQAILAGVDGVDGDPNLFLKQENWEEPPQPEAILADDTQEPVIRRNQLHPTPEYMDTVKVELLDPTDIMMLSHARRIRGFSRRRQAQLGMKIAHIVMEAELEEIAEEEAASSSLRS